MGKHYELRCGGGRQQVFRHKLCCTEKTFWGERPRYCSIYSFSLLTIPLQYLCCLFALIVLVITQRALCLRPCFQLYVFLWEQYKHNVVCSISGLTPAWGPLCVSPLPLCWKCPQRISLIIEGIGLEWKEWTGLHRAQNLSLIRHLQDEAGAPTVSQNSVSDLTSLQPGV